MKNCRIRNIIVAVAVAASLAMPLAHAGAESPTAQIKATVDRVISVLSDPELKAADRQGKRQNLLRELIYERFDFEEMAKRSLGTEWRRRAPEEQKEFTLLFRDLIEKA
jgi:phospholipid transport system substrate-binding protein